MKKYKILLAFLLALLMALLFISCAPQKRINRILKNNPHLLHKDTVKVTDTFTVITPGVQTDSLIDIESLKKDTVFITKENLTIKTYIRNDTLFVSGECDTIINEIVREILVPYETPVYHKAKDKLSWWEKLIVVLSPFALFILSMVIAYLSFSLNKKNKNK